MFQNKIKKMSVVDKDNILGLASLTDITRCQPTIIKLVKTFAAARDSPESMKEVINYYVV
jgi:signal-transduction protein with cAMP-binding, CBS, and nucleotidyltransferase domain